MQRVRRVVGDWWVVPATGIALLALAIELFRWSLEGPLGWIWPTDWEPSSTGGAAVIAIGLGVLTAHAAHYHRWSVMAIVNLLVIFFASLLLVLHLDTAGGRITLHAGQSDEPVATTAAPAAATAPTVTTAASPEPASSSQDSPSTWILRIAVGLALLPLLGKTIQMSRLARRWRARIEGNPEVQLLPSQTKVVAQLKDALTEADVGSAGQVIQLRGRWGDGKTFVLRQLVRDLQAQPVLVNGRTLAPVWLDVWEHESRTDLHAETVEQILSHPLHGQRLRWLGFPATFLRLIGPGLVFKAKVAVSEVELPIRLAALPYQRGLERSMKRSRGHAVLVLDEIDRASPLAAQTALTLLRRSLDLPNIAVVVPYVEEVLLGKAFSPRTALLPDLEALLHASLFQLWAEGGIVPGNLLQSIAKAGENGGAGDEASKGEPRLWPLRNAYAAAVAESFEGLAPTEQRGRQRFASGKMLDSRPVRMPLEIDTGELVSFLECSIVLSSLLRGLLGNVSAAPGQTYTMRDLVVAVGDVMPGVEEAAAREFRSEKAVPPIRDFQALMHDALPAVSEAGPIPSYADLAAFVAVTIGAIIHPVGAPHGH